MPVMEFSAVDYIYPEPLNTRNDNQLSYKLLEHDS